MLSKVADFMGQYGMVRVGDEVVCAVSGGADSVALLFALYLLKDKLHFSLSAAHFNHHLRGAESDRDQQFVSDFCNRYDIPLYLGGSHVTAGEKGLEAAARDARYAFLRTLPGKIATAHTADDNAETVLLHIIRGSGLKGLGAIAPVSGNVIRPMLGVTREDVEQFLAEYYLAHIEDSSNGTDSFLRNRIRHHVMPLLRAENPRVAQNISSMALRLRQDESYISGGLEPEMPTVTALRTMDPALRSRYLERFLKASSVREPEQSHIALAEDLVFSPKPSARANFPGGIVITRSYDRLEVLHGEKALGTYSIPCPGSLEIPDCGLRITCSITDEWVNTPNAFAVQPHGDMYLRARQAGDSMRLPGGTKTLKKLFIDAHIPAAVRCRVPVVADASGVLGVFGFGANLDRLSREGKAVVIRFEKTDRAD